MFSNLIILIKGISSPLRHLRCRRGEPWLRLGSMINNYIIKMVPFGSGPGW